MHHETGHDLSQLSTIVAWIAAGLASEPDQELLASLQARLEERAEEEPGSWLRTRLGLGESEAHVVWLLSAIAIDAGVRRRLAENGIPGDPTLVQLRTLVYGPAPSLRGIQELDGAGKLRSLGVIERSDGGSADLHEGRQTWAISRRVLRMLLGDASLDPAVERFAAMPQHLPALRELAIGAEALKEAQLALRRGNVCVGVSGMPGLGRRTLLEAAARDSGVEVLEVKSGRLSKEPALLKAEVRAIARECKLLRRAPLFADLDKLDAPAIDLVGADIAKNGIRMLFTCGTTRPSLSWDCPVALVELGQPSQLERARLWSSALGVGEADGDVIAARYPLAPALVVRAATSVQARRGPGALSLDDIAAGVRAVVDDKLSAFAERQEVTQTWADLVLPSDQRGAVEEFIARVRQRATVLERWGFGPKVGNKGLGVTALFSGPPGTGKSMCAGLIAKELGLELYVVDMAKVVSKWIGETEKSLSALFDAAEAGYAVLLFDEADALFGKRTEQKTSNDRYANQETNFLLRRLESFTGICILTTNHEANVDPAFARRLTLRLQFEMPEAEERARLWKAMVPAAARVDARVNFSALAEKYEMSGGYIRNAMLRAAFFAANQQGADGRITSAHLERAVRAEYEGMGKLVADSAGRLGSSLGV